MKNFESVCEKIIGQEIVHLQKRLEGMEYTTFFKDLHTTKKEILDVLVNNAFDTDEKIQLFSQDIFNKVIGILNHQIDAHKNMRDEIIDLQKSCIRSLVKLLLEEKGIFSEADFLPVRKIDTNDWPFLPFGYGEKILSEMIAFTNDNFSKSSSLRDIVKFLDLPKFQEKEIHIQECKEKKQQKLEQKNKGQMSFFDDVQSIDTGYNPRKKIDAKVISASIRTDIPAFYHKWLLDCVKQGYVNVRVPGRGKEHFFRKVSLLPDDVHTLALWSKNFGPMLKDIHELKEFEKIFHFTINSTSFYEPGLIALEKRLDQAQQIVDTFGNKRLLWRFDPIVFWGDEKNPKNNLKDFDIIVKKMGELGISRCYFSFADLSYGKIAKRLTRDKKLYPNAKLFFDPSFEIKLKYAEELAQKCKAEGITMHTCGMQGLDKMLVENVDNIVMGKCMDNTLFMQLTGLDTDTRNDTARQCGCQKHIDIGFYMPCPINCYYCYANPHDDNLVRDISKTVWGKNKS